MNGIYKTAPDDAYDLFGWDPIDTEYEVTRLPFVDRVTGLFARTDYAGGLEVADREGAALISRDEVLRLVSFGLLLKPVTLPTAEMVREMAPRSSFATEESYQAHIRKDMATETWARIHDVAVWKQLGGWDKRQPVMNAGKFWCAGAAPGRARICGWWSGGKLIQQGLRDNHGASHCDYATTLMLVRPRNRTKPSAPEPGAMTTRSTIRRGSTGDDVKRWQEILGVTADGVFGFKTDVATRAWQQGHHLVADGIVGERSWRAAGESWSSGATVAGDPRAPACVAAIRDANARWPGRRTTSDGIMGDARHQKTVSGHNAGNAVDISHDEASGCDGEVVARLALTDPRTAYVIWSRRIWNPGLGDAIDGPGRPYTKANPHTSHCHIEIKPEMREDDRPWPWATSP